MKRLDGSWSFETAPGEETDVLFECEYEMKYYGLAMICRLFLNQAVPKIIGAFEKRCAQLYQRKAAKTEALGADEKVH